MRRAALNKARGSGQRQLLAAFGLPEQIFAADEPALAAVLGQALARQVLSHDTRPAVERGLAWLQAFRDAVAQAEAEFREEVGPDVATVVAIGLEAYAGAAGG